MHGQEDPDQRALPAYDLIEKLQFNLKAFSGCRNAGRLSWLRLVARMPLRLLPL